MKLAKSSVGAPLHTAEVARSLQKRSDSAWILSIAAVVLGWFFAILCSLLDFNLFVRPIVQFVLAIGGMYVALYGPLLVRGMEQEKAALESGPDNAIEAERNELRRKLKDQRETARLANLGLWNSAVEPDQWQTLTQAWYLREGKLFQETRHHTFSMICDREDRGLLEEVPQAILFARDHGVCWENMVIGSVLWREGHQPGDLIDSRWESYQLFSSPLPLEILSEAQIKQLLLFVSEYDSVRHMKAATR